MIDMKKCTKHLSRMLYSNQNGAILIWLIITMVVVSIIGSSMVYLTTSSTFGVLFANYQMRAYYAAEAGGRYAIPLVSADVQTSTTTNMELLDKKEYTLNDNGKFLLEIDDNSPTYILIHSTGIINAGGFSESLVKITYHLNITQSPFQQAAYGSGVTLDNNAVTDSYDSSVGAYGGSNVGSNGDVTTESDSISLANNAVINGAQNTNASSDFSPVELPPGGTETDPFDYQITEDATLSSDTFRASQVKLDNGVQLSISGEVVLIVEQDFTLSNNSSIVLLSGATLSIYVDGNILFDNVSNINEGAVPGNFVIYGTSNTDSIEMKNVSTIYAVIYAPDSSIFLDNNAQLFGALIGDQVHMSNNAEIHFDEALITQVFDEDVPPNVGSIIQY